MNIELKAMLVAFIITTVIIVGVLWNLPLEGSFARGIL